VPPYDGVGPHDEQGGAPLRPRLGKEDPKESVRRAELWAPDRARQRGHLLAEREILERNGPCPGQISPIDRRSTISAVSMIDPAARPITKSTGDTSDQVLAKYRFTKWSYRSWNSVCRLITFPPTVTTGYQ